MNDVMVVAEAGVKLVALAMVPIVSVTWIGPAVAPLGTGRGDLVVGVDQRRSR